MRRRINVGAGEFPMADGWENIDITPFDGRVARGDARFYDYSFAEQVYAGHLIEHLTVDEARTWLRRVRAQAAPGCVLAVTTPAMERAWDADHATMRAIIGGEGRWPGDQHLSWWRADALAEEIRSAGWFGVAEWPDCPWLVARVPWQVCLAATKEPAR